jgi:hypothetical protein
MAITDQSIQELLADLDECDDASLHDAFIQSLRVNEGERLRAVLRMLQASDEIEPRLLARLLKQNPLLCDLIPN